MKTSTSTVAGVKTGVRTSWRGAAEKKTATMISAQASGHEALHIADTSELYAEDVQLISKNGKLYYLLENKDE